MTVRLLTILPEGRKLEAENGTNLMDVLKSAGISPDAPCGGNGRCGKCIVTVDGEETLACRTVINRDMTVEVPDHVGLQVLRRGIGTKQSVVPEKEGYLVAFDIGTTSVVCFLMNGKNGEELAAASIRNPQTVYGADVVSRIQGALRGEMEALTGAIRQGMTGLIRQVCGDASVAPEGVGVVSVVGNPAMQQLFLGISPENLARMPFAPVLTEAKISPCGEVLPICPNAVLLTVPDISGYIGADTVGCILSTGIHTAQEITLLVDIGTNGEMVLGNRDRMLACSAAAGPALEGANIRFGMRAAEGAIDHVWLEDGELRCSVIGGGAAKGICGSGLIDAVAAGLELGLLNRRGRIQNEAREIRLAGDVVLTQDDIRQVQLAKGAIHAGIVLMARQMGIGIGEIRRVLLAGAFGSFLDSRNACRIGLLPEKLENRITAVGNAAGSGAKMLACDSRLLHLSEELTAKIEFLELAAMEDFMNTFAESMYFPEESR